MSGLHRTLKKAKPKELLHMKMSRKVDDTMIDATKSLSPDLPPEKSAIPMPDEEEIKRSRRRANAARGGGRASTILTGGDYETLG